VKKRINLDTTETNHKGIKGLFELLLRRFKNGMHIATMFPVYFAGAVVIGVCMYPGVALFQWASDMVSDQSKWLQNLVFGIALATGFILYGITLVFVCPAINFVLRGNLKAWRGPYYSAEAFKWYIHNALTYVPRYTFLEFICPSPMLNLFYQMMGMKVGRGTVMNTTYISDPSLISLGKKVTLGGSVTIVAHYGQGGMLVIAPVKIGDGCTLGLKATVMGGVTIGNDVKIMPHSVVMPKTVIPDGEVWGGVPAVKIERVAKPKRKSPAA